MPEFRHIPLIEIEKYIGRPRTVETKVARTVRQSGDLTEGIPVTIRQNRQTRQTTKELPGSLVLYLEEINQYPRLSTEQENILFAHIRNGRAINDLRESSEFLATIPDEEQEKYRIAFEHSSTLEELAFHCNLYRVVSLVRRYPSHLIQDLIQHGNIGLYKAVKRHDLQLGIFAAYVYWYIRGEMSSALPDIMSPIRTPEGMRHLVSRSRKIESEFELQHGRKPTKMELRHNLEIQLGLSERTVNTVFEVMSSGIMYPKSLDSTIFPDEDTTLHDRIADGNVNVEEEALRSAENEEYVRRRRPSAREAAVNMGTSVPTASRALRKLVDAGILALHPRDPRNVDAFGYTEHTRNQDAMILSLLQEDARLTKGQIVEALAQPDKLGKRLSTLTVRRAISRLVEAGLIPPRPRGRPGGISKDGRSLNSLVEELLQKDPKLRNNELLEILSSPDLIGKRVSIVTIKRSIVRLIRAGKQVKEIKSPRKDTSGISSRAALQKYLDEHQNEPINRSEIARQIGVSRERIRQLYDEIKKRK